jgi:hypothetical protein
VHHHGIYIGVQPELSGSPRLRMARETVEPSVSDQSEKDAGPAQSGGGGRLSDAARTAE